MCVISRIEGKATRNKMRNNGDNENTVSRQGDQYYKLKEMRITAMSKEKRMENEMHA